METEDYMNLSLNYKNAVNDVLFSGDDLKRILSGIDGMQNIYNKITSLNNNDLAHSKAINAKKGIAVSKEVAAYCLKDTTRTTQFLRGIHRAIEEKLKQAEKIRVLYAGCGPYATLITPLTQVFSSDQVAFTFLDINNDSLSSVKSIYNTLHLNSFIEEYIEMDATDPSIEMRNQFDIIVSETMQSGLRNECQVSITRNMIRFLKPDGVFIPEQILIDIYLVKNENTYTLEETQKQYLGNAYNLDFRHMPEQNSKIGLTVPDSDFNYLVMLTEIKVYGGFKLTYKDSNLTSPLVLSRFDKNLPRSVYFKYLETECPGFEITYDFEEAVFI